MKIHIIKEIEHFSKIRKLLNISNEIRLGCRLSKYLAGAVACELFNFWQKFQA